MPPPPIAILLRNIANTWQKMPLRTLYKNVADCGYVVTQQNYKMEAIIVWFEKNEMFSSSYQGAGGGYGLCDPYSYGGFFAYFCSYKIGDFFFYNGTY